jgi:hypothetical protein
MKIIVKTVYADVDQSFVNWYCDTLKKHDNFPSDIADDLKETGKATFQSGFEGKIATTTYEVVK